MTNHDKQGGGRRGRWKERDGNRFDMKGDNNFFGDCVGSKMPGGV